MKLQELIEILQCCDPESEVLMAQQKHWAMEYEVADCQELKIYNEYDDDDNPVGDGRKVVYIAEGEQLGYLHQGVKEQLDW